MNELFVSGHTACAGCGITIAVRNILKTLGKDVIVVNPTGCLEIFSSQYPTSAWNVPYIHPLFENAAPVSAGIVEALRAKGNSHTKVVVIGGDGSLYDIGFGHLSGALERGHDVLYIVTDNEAYMNTGIQRSGATPFMAKTTTSQVGKIIRGKLQQKKPLTEIVAAHRIAYAAQTSIAYMKDLENKVKKAAAIKGPTFINVLTPCVPGWGYEPSKTVELAKLAVETSIWPVYEIENGVLNINIKPNPRKHVREYLKTQKRFKHLTEKEMDGIEELVKKEWERILKIEASYKTS